MWISPRVIIWLIIVMAIILLKPEKITIWLK